MIVIGFAAYVYFGEFRKSHDDQLKKEHDSMLLPEIAFDQVSHIEWWMGPNETLVVDKKDGDWQLTVPHPLDDPSHPIMDKASTEQVENFLKKFLQLRSTETVVKGLFDEKTFGLDMPMAEIKLAQPSSSKLHEIRVGSIKAYDASLYAQVDDDKAVVLIESASQELFRKSPSEFRERSLYRGNPKAAWTIISVTKIGQPVLQLVRKDGAWSAPASPKLQLDTPAVEAYIKRLENIQTVDFTYEMHEGKNSDHELKPFQLDHPYLLVELKSSDGKTWQLRLSNAKKENAQAGGMQASVMATASDVPAIVKVLDQNLKIIDKRADDFVRAEKPTPTASPKG